MLGGVLSNSSATQTQVSKRTSVWCCVGLWQPGADKSQQLDAQYDDCRRQFVVA